MRRYLSIRKFAISIALGCLFTILLFAYGILLHKGPSLIVAIVVIPIQIISSAIAPEPEVGEIVFWLLMVGFWSLLSYIAVYVVLPYIRKN